MKRVFVLLTLVFALSFIVMAEEWTGYIADAGCAAKRGKAAASDAHAGCAGKCIKGGAAAVLVTEEGKVYKIADQDKVADHAGHKETISGKMDGETIKVNSVKM